MGLLSMTSSYHSGLASEILAQVDIKNHMQSYLLITNQFVRGGIGLLHCYFHLVQLFIDSFYP